MKADAAARDKDRYKVHRGEPGANIVTPLKNGYPVIENPPVALASGSPSLFPIHDRYNKIAHYRANLILTLNNHISKRNGLIRESIKEFLKKFNAGMLLPDIREKLGSISAQTLYRFQKTFDEFGVKGLTPQYGGEGKSKITEHEKNLVLTLCLHQNRLKVAHAITLAKEYLEKKSIDSPSSSSTFRRFVDQFRKEHYDIWILRREGEKALKDKVLPYAERDWRLIEVGEGLVADGHRLNFQIIDPDTGKPCRAALVVFWDWRSSYPLGWEIMLEESIQCVASALRNAIIALGKFPKWIYLDNGKAFKAKIFTEDIDIEDGELPGMFARLNINYHFAQPYNAQSKPIERIFGILNEQLERIVPSYTGASINDKPAWTKRNEKLARLAHDPWVPTIQEANNLIQAWRDRYAERPSRGRNGLRPIDIFNDGKGPGVDPLELIYLMMDRKIKTVHRNGVTWLGWHWYDEALYGLKDKVVIRYSLSDLSQIYVFYKNEFLCTARPVEQVHPMASESENPKDMEAVKKVIRLKKKVKNTTHKLCDLLNSKPAAQIDWSKIKTEGIAETIQKIEEIKKPKIVKVLPFPDVPDNSNMETAKEQDTKNFQRPMFDYDFEKYDWLMEQDKITPDDREFIDLYRKTSSLQKHNVFTDDEELDRKTISIPINKSERETQEIKQNNKAIKVDLGIEFNRYDKERPWFKDDYERYTWLMKQDSIDEDDREFISKFRAESSLYKQMIFSDDEELDEKILHHQRAVWRDAIKLTLGLKFDRKLLR